MNIRYPLRGSLSNTYNVSNAEALKAANVVYTKTNN